MKAFLILGIVLLAIDLYAFKGISLLINHYASAWVLKILFWAVNILIYLQLYRLISNYRSLQVENPDVLRFWSGIIITIFITKLGFIFFHLLDDLFWGGKKLANFTQSKIQSTNSNTISRGKFLTQIGAGAAALLLGSFTYGVTKGRYAFQVMKEKIHFDNLPESFSGLKIVQISDLHLGSFVKDFEDVKVGIDLINAQNPDYIFFTGDMVNSHCAEAEPWIDLFASLEAKEGKYSVFGNHDYADYGPYSPTEKAESIARLKEIHREMGFKLLEDENLYIEKNGEKIALAGMHNWGKDFHRVGNINNTLQGLSEDDFTILLSHDPSLWEEEINNKRKVELTLSGHTHGMQMGVEIPFLNLKWSPVKYRYKRWAGLYEEAKNYIYVNRGFGFLGFPGRVGMKPEITVLELFTKKA
ncbi:MAG: metallophosphoesterase [Chitinophagales bacterium]